jgi:hypothetical protein
LLVVVLGNIPVARNSALDDFDSGSGEGREHMIVQVAGTSAVEELALFATLQEQARNWNAPKEQYIRVRVVVDVRLLCLDFRWVLGCGVAIALELELELQLVLALASESDSEVEIVRGVGLEKTEFVLVPSRNPFSPFVLEFQLLSMVSSLNQVQHLASYSYFQQRVQPRSQVVLEVAPSEWCFLVTGHELESLGTKQDSFH